MITVSDAVIVLTGEEVSWTDMRIALAYIQRPS